MKGQVRVELQRQLWAVDRSEEKKGGEEDDEEVG